jgi:hypothetical protein
MIRRLTLAATIAVAVPSLQAQRPATGVADSVRIATVTYLSGQSVYIGVGRVDGVREGTTMEVMRAGDVIATLRALFLSSRSTSAEIVTSITMPAVGDSVRYRPASAAAAVASADSSTVHSGARSRKSSWRRPIQGHAGLRYSQIDRPNAGATPRPQPSADLHIEGSRVGGSPVGFTIDSRSRRVVGANSATGSSSNRILVYEGSMSLAHQGSGTRVSLGRQYSAALSTVSLFDGAVVEVTRPAWGVGVFGGVQPDPTLMRFSTAVREAGGYLQFHNRPASGLPWSFTTGAVDSRDLGEINREFAFMQFSASSRRVTLYALQEVDVNRGWKREVGEPAVSLTSSFATVQIRPADWLSVNGGVDNRRNVRLYRDYVSPETEFDDAFRQGVWGGLSLTRFRLRAGADARVSRGGSAGSADYYTGSLGLDAVTRFRLEARLRSTRFQTTSAQGWLHSWSAATAPLGVAKFEVNGGLRTRTIVSPPVAATSFTPAGVLADSRWLGFSLDVNVGRSWYVLLSGTRDGTGAELTNHVYASLVFRF